jgi:hypothetical protein
MPHPKGNVKLSGDTHLPDAESDLDIEQGSSGMGDLARERTQSGRRGSHARKAGVLTAEDGSGAIAAVNRADNDSRQASTRDGQGAAPAMRPAQGNPLVLLAAGLLLLVLVRKILR